MKGTSITNVFENGRRDLRQDPKQKAKEKLWESIVSAAEVSESDDDDQIWLKYKIIIIFT